MTGTRPRAVTFDCATEKDAAKHLREIEAKGYECSYIVRRDNTLTYHLAPATIKEEEKDVQV